jgi:Uma2 family endonuclease
MPPASGGDSWSAISLATALVTFVASRGLGRVTGADGEFVLSKPDEPLTSLAPDVAFVRTGRYPSPATPEYRRPWHIAPDLAVEIASPNQYRPELAEKARRYLEAGVLLLWIVWPKYRQVDVWRPGSHQPVATLADVDFLDGLDILPGFTFPVTDLFT